MTPAERELLEKLDNLVLTASGDELRKIQEMDIQTQMQLRLDYRVSLKVLAQLESFNF